MNWINKSLFAWLYYSKKKPHRYNDIEDKKQLHNARKAMEKGCIDIDMLQKTKAEYLEEVSASIDKLIEGKTGG